MSLISKKKTGSIVVRLAAFVLALLLFFVGIAPEASATIAYEQVFVDVAIGSGNRISINDQVVSLGDFEQEITNYAGGDPSKVVINLKCEADMPMAVIFDIQNKLVAMDLMQVSYQSDTTKPIRFELPTQQTHFKTASVPGENIVTVAIDDSGRVTFNGQEVVTEKIAETTKARVKQNNKTIVSLQVQDGAIYSDFVTVLAEVQKGGAPRILIDRR